MLVAFPLRLQGQHRTGHLVGTEGGAALAAEFIAQLVDIAEGIKGKLLGTVDGLGNGTVHVFLRRRLHHHVISGAEALGVHETVGQGHSLALELAELAIGVIGHFFRLAAAVGLQHIAGIAVGEDGLDPRGNIVGIKGDGPRGRDGGEQSVADAVFSDCLAHFVLKTAHGFTGKVFLGVEQGKRPLFPRQLGGGQIGGAANRLHPSFRHPHRLFAAIAHAVHDQGIGKAGNAKANATLGFGLVLLLGQGKVGEVDHIVEHAHRYCHQFFELRHIQMGPLLEGIAHQRRQVDRTQKAGAVRRQGLFATRVGGVDFLAVIEVVEAVDAVDEDDPRLGEAVGGTHNLVPQIARRQAFITDTVESEFPGGTFLDRVHESVGHQHRQVEHAQPSRLLLGLDKVLDIGMVTTQGRHHRPAAGSGAHDGAAHGIPHIHKGQRPRGVRPDAFNRRALGPQ